ncbi:MAG: DUF2442 domain-containing protein [Deltaproteobacteria bacterium]|nr:DUF2442 domain-containing protein [Deltaproteobacteria bacterium]
MSIVASTEARIRDVKVTADIITAYLVDGRVISVPLAWSWRLSEATPAQRAHWELIGDGQGIHWPAIDEDLSAEGMLHGVPAHRPRRLAPGSAILQRGRHEPPNKQLQPTKARERFRSPPASRLRLRG